MLETVCNFVSILFSAAYSSRPMIMLLIVLLQQFSCLESDGTTESEMMQVLQRTGLTSLSHLQILPMHFCIWACGSA